MKNKLIKSNFIIIICAIASCVGCTKNDKLNYSHLLNTTYETSVTNNGNLHVESQEIKLSFEEAIEMSNCAVKAEYVAFHDKGNYVEYEFKVNELLFGDIPETVFYLFDLKGTSHVEDIGVSYKNGDNKYIKGNKYILIMEKQESLFYNNDARYMLLSNIFISLNNINESTMYGKSIKDNAQDTFTNNTDISQYIKDVKNLNAKSILINNDKLSYIKSDKLEVIVNESDLILELLIEDIESVAPIHNGVKYICNVENVIKGDVKEDIGDKVKVLLLKDSVSIGGKYIVMLNNLGNDAYLQSSKDSIISVDDNNLVSEVSTYIKKTNQSMFIILEKNNLIRIPTLSKIKSK